MTSFEPAIYLSNLKKAVKGLDALSEDCRVRNAACLTELKKASTLILNTYCPKKTWFKKAPPVPEDPLTGITILNLLHSHKHSHGSSLFSLILASKRGPGALKGLSDALLNAPLHLDDILNNGPLTKFIFNLKEDTEFRGILKMRPSIGRCHVSGGALLSYHITPMLGNPKEGSPEFEVIDTLIFSSRAMFKPINITKLVDLMYLYEHFIDVDTNVYDLMEEKRAELKNGVLDSLIKNGLSADLFRFIGVAED